ncbi:MAG: hypothetical protein INR65_03210, partial [Gluconacetobacter diazotrophicus]|nr:hypothetical protein [Gluconacetobacter diazotrophicus]
MSGLVGLLGSEAVSSLAAPVVSRLLDLVPNPERRAEEAATAADALLDADLALSQRQVDLNLVEARSETLFVSGWRPFIGWSCGLALLWQILLAPFVIFNCAVFNYHPVVPPLDTEWMSLILVPLLGLGAMRTVEKLNRVAGPLMGTPAPAAVPVPAAVPAAAANVAMTGMLRRAALADLLSRPPRTAAVPTPPAPTAPPPPPPSAPPPTDAARIRAACEQQWPAHRGDCAGFVRAV